MPKLNEHFTTVTAKQKGELKVYKAVCQPMQCLFVPVGYLMADASGAGVMHYGIRKSFFPVSASGPGRYKANGRCFAERQVGRQEDDLDPRIIPEGSGFAATSVIVV